MPYNGSGIFTPSVTFLPNTEAKAEDVQAAITDLAEGLSDAMTRDGQAPATAPMSLGGNSLTEMAAGVNPGDGVNVRQIQSGAIPALKSIIGGISGTLRSLFFQTIATANTPGSNRFEWQLDSEAESGDNVGSNLLLQAYADDGVTTTRVALVNRATGIWNWLITPTFNGESLAALISASCPPGKVDAFATGATPPGWLSADGTSYAQASYPALFAAIGTTYGSGSDTSGKTTFQVPDLRGVFVRGLDNGKGYDFARALGTYQADALQDHAHAYVQPNNQNLPVGGSGATANSGLNNNNPVNTGSPVAPASKVTPSISTETRPKNVALFYCIKT